MTDERLPAGFADLAHFVDDWALASEKARYWKLHESTMEELRPFYDAMLPRIDDIVAHINQYDRGELPAPARTLFYLAMTFAETAHPLDLGWKDVDFDEAYDWRKFGFTGVSVEASE